MSQPTNSGVQGRTAVLYFLYFNSVSTFRQAAGSQGHGGLPGKAQGAMPLDGKFRGVAAELLVVLNDVGVRRGDAAGIVDVVMLYFLLR